LAARCTHASRDRRDSPGSCTSIRTRSRSSQRSIVANRSPRPLTVAAAIDATSTICGCAATSRGGRLPRSVDLVPGEDGGCRARADLVEHALDDRDLLLGLGIGRVDDVSSSSARRTSRACS
jgi:hypothetical protein